MDGVAVLYGRRGGRRASLGDGPQTGAVGSCPIAVGRLHRGGMPCGPGKAVEEMRDNSIREIGA